MKYNVTDRQLKIARIVCVAVIAIAVILGCIAEIVSSNASPVSVSQPATASQVASSLNCGRFTDFGSGLKTNGMVVDSGSCWIGNAKYGIDTFVSQDVRDMWLKLAEPLGGVVPKWETATSVVYLATS